jgi:hypothetical protein
VADPVTVGAGTAAGHATAGGAVAAEPVTVGAGTVTARATAAGVGDADAVTAGAGATATAETAAGDAATTDRTVTAGTAATAAATAGPGVADAVTVALGTDATPETTPGVTVVPVDVVSNSTATAHAAPFVVDPAVIVVPVKPLPRCELYAPPVGEDIRYSPTFAQFVGAVLAVPTVEACANRVRFPVSALLANTVDGAVPPATLSSTSVCRTASDPTRDIPDASPMMMAQPVASSPVQSNVTVIDDGDPGVSWSATKNTSRSALVFFTAVTTRVKVIPLADAVRVGAAVVVPGADTNTASSEPSVGVNDPDAYDESLVVVPVVSRCDHAATAASYGVRSMFRMPPDASWMVNVPAVTA